MTGLAGAGAGGSRPRGLQLLPSGPLLRLFPQTVGQQVAAEVTVSPEHLGTGGAAVGPDVCVGQQVRLQVGALVEAATAGGAAVRRLLHVQDLVDCQGPGLAEALAAHIADEWFFL